MHYRLLTCLCFGLVACGSDSTDESGGDHTPPTITIVSPVAGPVSGTVSVTAEVSDNGVIDHVVFRMNGADQGPIDFTAPYTHEWNPAVNGAGTYDWEATAYDRGGNQQTSATVRVTYGL